MKLYVEDIIKYAGGKLIVGNEKIELINFSKDTRTINENDVYVGIKGENFDGNIFYEEALKKGASVCILDNINEKDIDIKKYSDKAIVIVDNAITCLQKLAEYKRSLYDIPVIAITGSVGKTSTKDMVSAVLNKKYKVLKTEGNNNNHIGVPLTILRMQDHNCLVVEMGMNHLNEISVLSKIAKPTIAIITNVTTAHIGNLGSRENILKAKLEILEGLSKDGQIIINNDNDMLNSATPKLTKEYNLITIGIENESTYQAKNINITNTYSEFTVDNNKLRVKVASTPFIYNSLIAYAVGSINKISVEDIKDAIKNFELSKNRLSIQTNKKGVTIIDDSYNANYDSMKMGIEILNKTKGIRKIAILGDMLELGEYTKEMHQKIAKVVVENNIDILITIGNYSKYIDEEVISLGFNNNNMYHFNTTNESIDSIMNIIKKDDVVLLKASHSIGLVNIAKKLLEN